MGILEEKNMLYFLAFRIFMCLLIPTLIFADEQRVDFFKKRSVFVQSEDCSECSKGPNLLNPDLKAKSEEIESIVTGSFAKKQSQLTNEIIFLLILAAELLKRRSRPWLSLKKIILSGK